MRSLIVVLTLLTMEVMSADVYCNGQRCQNTCDATGCTNYCQQGVNCLLSNNCFCPSTSIPGGISLANAPQFFFLTFDDSLNQKFVEDADLINKFFRNNSFLDSKGCHIKPTFFTQTDNSDYNVVYLFDQMGEIGLHSVTHTTAKDSVDNVWDNEIKYNIDWIKEFSGIENINSSRAPFLAYNDNYFQSLLQHDILIDSSVLTVPYQNSSTLSKRYWPYTLDFGLPDRQICNPNNQGCLTRNYPKLWEINMQATMNMTDYKMLFDMDPPVTNESYSALLQGWKNNFDLSYSQNKAPYGIYLHYFWFFNSDGTINQLKERFLADMLLHVVTKSNLLFVTEKDVISWMKNPQTYTAYAASHTCNTYNPPSNLTNSCAANKTATTCPYLEKELDMKICQGTCPIIYPNIRANLHGDGQCQIKENFRIIEDCTSPDCPKCLFNWEGKVDIVYDQVWETGMCLSFELTNLNNMSKPAITYFLQIKTCGLKMTTGWGNIANRYPGMFESQDGSITYVFMSEQKYQSYNVTNYKIGACFSKNGDKEISGVDVKSLLKARVDYTDVYQFKSEQEFYGFSGCGDHRCIESEKNTCKFDCDLDFCFNYYQSTGSSQILEFTLLIFLIFYLL